LHAGEGRAPGLHGHPRRRLRPEPVRARRPGDREEDDQDDPTDERDQATTIHQPDLFGVQAGISASLVAGRSAESYESGERPPGHLSTVGT